MRDPESTSEPRMPCVILHLEVRGVSAWIRATPCTIQGCRYQWTLVVTGRTRLKSIGRDYHTKYLKHKYWLQIIVASGKKSTNCPGEGTDIHELAIIGKGSRSIK